MTTHTPSPSSKVRKGLMLGLLAAVLLSWPLNAAQNGATTSSPAIERVTLVAGRSMVLNTDFDVTRVALTDPTVADVSVVSARELLIDGKKAGTISLFVWGADRRMDREVVIEPGVTSLQQRMHDFFPNEAITASVTDDAIVLLGTVSNSAIALRAAEIAAASAPKAKVINLLQVPGGPGSQQVMLQVRFAEVNRRAVTELGASVFSNRMDSTGRTSTQQFAAPDYDDKSGGPDDMTFSDLLNIFFFQRDKGVGAVVKALKQHGDFQSLAEPNLIAYSGQEASFLAGGEFPVPVVQGATGTVSVIFKEFGVRLRFKPTISGDTIRLHVRPEVSALDFNNGVTLQGFRIPSLTTRYAETEVELQDGQSFAIAGLIDSVVQSDKAAIPFLSQIPIIGYLFKSKADRDDRTELMVLITARLVHALNPNEVPPLPTSIKPIKKDGGKDGGKELGSLVDGAGLIDAPTAIIAAPTAAKPAAAPRKSR